MLLSIHKYRPQGYPFKCEGFALVPQPDLDWTRKYGREGDRLDWMMQCGWLGSWKTGQNLHPSSGALQKIGQGIIASTRPRKSLAIRLCGMLLAAAVFCLLPAAVSARANVSTALTAPADIIPFHFHVRSEAHTNVGYEVASFRSAGCRQPRRVGRCGRDMIRVRGLIDEMAYGTVRVRLLHTTLGPCELK